MRVDTRRVQPVARRFVRQLRAHGLSFQRSQNSGRSPSAAGPNYGYYKRVGLARERRRRQGDGLLRRHRHVARGLFKTLGRPKPAGAAARLAADRQAPWTRRSQTFTVHRSVGVGAGARPRPRGAPRGQSTRVVGEPGRRVHPRAQGRPVRGGDQHRASAWISTRNGPAGRPPSRPVRARPSRRRRSMGAVVPGQTFDVRVHLQSRRLAIMPDRASRSRPAPAGRRGRSAGAGRPRSAEASVLAAAVRGDARRRCPDQHATRTSARTSIQDAVVSLADAAQFGLPASRRRRRAVVRYSVDGVAVEVARDRAPPRGQAALRRRAARAARWCPPSARHRRRRDRRRAAGAPRPSASACRWTCSTTAMAGARATVALRLPAGWTSEPAQSSVRRSRVPASARSSASR